jgi:protein tyrosine phosphatase (PTP) superfamily phosphohydrolase (DUF442 family)
MRDSYHFQKNTDLITSSGKMSESCLSQLSKHGYQLVINLLPATDRRAIPDEQQIIESQGISYSFIPVDFKAPKQTDYQQFENVLSQHLDQKVHIHCAANYRASAFYAVFAYQHSVWSKQRAEQFILDIWQPKEHAVWQLFLQESGLFL